MCGLAGFTNVAHLSAPQRVALVMALGKGTDSRGGHAAGYVGARAGRILYGRKVGEWGGASARFVADCASADVAVIHGRYATCGKRDSAEQAHPFAVKRPSEAHDGAARTRLYGAHNGVLRGTLETARAHGRPHDVDSRELFELLADGKLDVIARDVSGYGTIAWIDSALRDRVRLATVSEYADLVIAVTACGAVIFASTWKIVHEACAAAALTVSHQYEPETGKVYEAHADGRVTYSEHADVRVNEGWSRGDYVAEKYSTKAYSARAGYAARPAWLYDAQNDYWDDCPVCHSWDTWDDQELIYCADCGHSWPAKAATSEEGITQIGEDIPPLPGAEDDVSGEWDTPAFERWLASERAHAKGGTQ